jgi:hypothetical protein
MPAPTLTDFENLRVTTGACSESLSDPLLLLLLLPDWLLLALVLELALPASLLCSGTMLLLVAVVLVLRALSLGALEESLVASLLLDTPTPALLLLG